MKGSKKWGICCLVTPFVGLVLVLATWAIISAIMGQMAMSNTSAYQEASAGEIRLERSDARVAAANMINVALGFVGIIFVLMIPVGLPVGIILLVKKDPVQIPAPNQTSGPDVAPVAEQASTKPPEPPAAPAV